MRSPPAVEEIDRTTLISLVCELPAAVDLLTDTMGSHLADEERVLLEPLARVGYH